MSTPTRLGLAGHRSQPDLGLALPDRGLVPGLLIDSLLTVSAVAFLLTTRRLPDFAKKAFFGLVVAATGYAVINNYRAIEALGISPLGVG